MTFARSNGPQLAGRRNSSLSTGPGVPIYGNTYSNNQRNRPRFQRSSQNSNPLRNRRRVPQTRPPAPTTRGALSGTFTPGRQLAGSVRRPPAISSGNLPGLLGLLIESPALGRQIGTGLANGYLWLTGKPIPQEPYEQAEPAVEQPVQEVAVGTTNRYGINPPPGGNYFARVYEGPGFAGRTQGFGIDQPPYNVYRKDFSVTYGSNWVFESYDSEGNLIESGNNGAPRDWRWKPATEPNKVWEIYERLPDGSEQPVGYDFFPAGEPRPIATPPNPSQDQGINDIQEAIEDLQDAQDALSDAQTAGNDTINDIDQFLEDNLNCNICDLLAGLGSTDLSGVIGLLQEVLQQLAPISQQFSVARFYNADVQGVVLEPQADGSYKSDVGAIADGKASGKGLDFMFELLDLIYQQAQSPIPTLSTFAPHLLLDVYQQKELPICDENVEAETPEEKAARERTIQGTGIIAVKQLLDFNSDSLGVVHKEVCDKETEVITSETIEYQIKNLVKAPKLIINFFKIIDGVKTSPKYCLTIPYFPDVEGDLKVSPIPEFEHGVYTSEIIFPTNQRIRVNAISENEAERIAKTAFLAIPPEKREGAEFKRTVRRDNIQEGKLVPRFARYYPTGIKKDGYTWEVSFST